MHTEGKDLSLSLVSASAQQVEPAAVAVNHRRAAWFKSLKNLRLGFGDVTLAIEILQMRDLHIGNDRHVRPYHFHQRADFAGMVHADFENTEFCGPGHPRQRQRHAPVIVERADRRMGCAKVGKHCLEHFLGAGLADRAGHRDNPGGAASAGGAAKIFQRP